MVAAGSCGPAAAITAMATRVPEIAPLGLTDSRAHMRDRNLLA
jgi:hypothetical protein